MKETSLYVYICISSVFNILTIISQIEYGLV
jgi:hypothetical protein